MPQLDWLELDATFLESAILIFFALLFYEIDEDYRHFAGDEHGWFQSIVDRLAFWWIIFLLAISLFYDVAIRRGVDVRRGDDKEGEIRFF
jgi:hypothetical protein